MIFFDVDALIRDGRHGIVFTERGDADFDAFVYAGVAPLLVGAPADFCVEGLEIDVGEIEQRSGDVFAGVVDDISDPAAPVFTVEGETESVVVEHRSAAGSHARGAMVVVLAPVRHGAGIEVGTVSEVKHSNRAIKTVQGKTATHSALRYCARNPKVSQRAC